jgi:hypothetical protein
MKAFAASMAVLLFGAAASVAAAGGSSASVVASSYKPGAKVALTFSMKYPMQCADPGRTLVIRLPDGMSKPARINPVTVRVNGAIPKTVNTSGSAVSIQIGQKQWITCDLVGMGNLSVVIGTAAGLTNPKKTGVYGFPIAIGTIHGTPMLRIT